MTKIYLVTNCYGDPNKVYIGKTKNCRYKDHKITYGKNITYNYIDEVNSLNRIDWEPLETYWIEQFRQWGFEIVNPRKKGGGGPDYQTEETKQKMRKPREYFPRGKNHSSFGIPKTEEHKKNIQKPKKNTEKLKKPKTEEHKQNLRKPKNHGYILSVVLKGKKRTKIQIQNITDSKKKKLKVTNTEANIILYFDSIKDASIKVGKSRTIIWNYIHNKTIPPPNEIWEFLN